MEIMTHILLNLPESYENKIGNIEEILDDDNYTLTIERILDKILGKYDGTNVVT